MNPKISVVMTSYNAQKYIKEAIDSILGQTFKDFEFIIVDNCSTDQTAEIISSYQDSRVVFIRNPSNLGQTKALNLGISKSKGEFIARMDADDVSLPNRFEIQYNYLLNNPTVDVVGAWYSEMDEHGKHIRNFQMPTDPLEIKCYLLGASQLSYHSVPHPIVLMRRQPVFDGGLYNEKYNAQDFDLWVRLSRKYLFSNIPQILFKYRLTPTAQTRQFKSIADQDCQNIIDDNIKFFMPEIKPSEFEILSRMLNFSPQQSKEEGELVFDIFDRFFKIALGQYVDHSQVKQCGLRMKIYYLPKLFLTNKVLALKSLISFLSKDFLVLLNIKFYSKFAKTLGAIKLR